METFTIRQIKLLQCFHPNEILTASQLSKELKISERTIRNEIRTINEQYPELILSIKSKGYMIDDKNPILSLLDEDGSTIGRTRYLYIIKQILSQKETDYYQLSDELYISESTLDKQLNSINQIIERRNPNMQIRRRNNKLIINGSEEERRQIYTYLMNHEMDQYNFNLNNYTEFFNSCNINDLKAYFLDFSEHHHLKLRDFEIISFILHIAIMLERVNKGNEITNIEGYHPSAEAEALAHDFYKGLSEKFHVTLSDMELTYLSCLFSGKISDIQDQKIQEYRTFISEIMNDIQQQYDLDLHQDQDFQENLLIHFLGLDNRIRSNSFLSNPLIKDIKLHFPLLYDISVYIAMKMQSRTHTVLLEDEIGYITLHIMNAVEKIQHHTYKKVVIVNPMSTAVVSFLKQRLMRCSDLTIDITGTFSIFDIEKVKECQPDIVISFIPLPEALDIPVYVCKGFPKDDDLKRIVHLLKTNITSNHIELQSFFHQDLFFTDIDVASKEEAIHFICDKLLQKGYCSSDYEEKILAREKIAPTAYGNYFAIPHPIEKCAKENAVSVCILKHPITWNNRKIRLIFLFALSPQKDIAFDELFEKLVGLLNDASRVKLLMKEKDYSSFLMTFTDNESHAI